MDRALVVVALGVVVAALVLLLRARSASAPARVDPRELGLGRSGVGVVGFSTPYCHPCRLWESALGEAGVEFVKVDVAERPDLARKYGVTATPLILAVSLPGGDVLAAHDGAPEPGDVARVAHLASTAG